MVPPPRSRSEAETVLSEDIHIRNFDVKHAYDLRLELSIGEDVVFTDRYYLLPGATRSETNQLPSNEYTVVAILDGHRCDSTRCRIDSHPSQTALIEVGNGTVSITEGLYS